MNTDLEFIAGPLENVNGWLLPGAAFLTARLMDFQTGRRISGSIFEIGVFEAKYLALLHRKRAAGEMVLGVDTFQWSQAEVAEKNVLAANGSVNDLKLLKQDSTTLAADTTLALLGTRPRFVSIDGAHFAEPVRSDLMLAEAIIAEEGVVALDDFLNPVAIGVNEGFYKYAFATEQRKLVPFLYIENKLFLCNRHKHDTYFNFVLDMFDGDENFPAKERFLDLYNRGRHWVEHELVGTKLWVV